MDFALPPHLPGVLAELDAFVDSQIAPLESGVNAAFFDHRREFARTDPSTGAPVPEWESLLREMRRRADAAGWLRYALPSSLGGRDGTNLDMAVIREHLAHRELGLHNELQTESSVVGNFPMVFMLREYGTPEQQAEWTEPLITGERLLGFGLTEPLHGSDATWMETSARADGDSWVIDGVKRFNSGMHRATHDLVFARTSGSPGDGAGITAFLVPVDSPGFTVDFMWWTFNMPSDHAEVTLRSVRVPSSCVLGPVGGGLQVAQSFVHENRIRQAASSLGAAQYCVDRAVDYARERVVFGRPLAVNQAIQWPLVELQTECEMLRLLVRRTALELDQQHHLEVSHHVAMCNYRANRLCCDAADRAMQVFGGMGYTRHEPFEHIYRHHRRYRITEGSEEIQMRRVAQQLFSFGKPKR